MAFELTPSTDPAAPARVDSIQNIAGLSAVLNANGDLGILRGWCGKDGRSYHLRTLPGTHEPQQRVMVTNAPTTLTYEDWVAIDTSVTRALMTRLAAFADLRASGLTYNLPNGMAHTVLRYSSVSDITPATVSMDPKRRSEGDRVQFDMAQMPLPIVHKDFDINFRELLASRNGNMPLDTTMFELAAQKVAEMVEALTVGTQGPFSDQSGSVWGYINFPNRATKTDMTVPTGTNNQVVIGEILSLRQTLYNNKHYGPFRLYFNRQWATILDTPDVSVPGGPTLRQFLENVGFTSISILDTLPTTQWHTVMVEMDSMTARAIIGIEIQTVSMESLFGFMGHHKVLALLLPNLRPDSAGNSGIAHGRTAV